MKNKIGISLVVTMLVVLSTFSIVTAEDEEYKGEVLFIKEVWNDDSGYWEESTEAEIDEVVSFRISLTYHMDEYYNNNPLRLYNIEITDELPPYLEYIEGSANIKPTSLENNIIQWSFLEPMLYIYDEESLVIEFDALVVIPEDEPETGSYLQNINCLGEEYSLENINIACFTAIECGIYEHGDSDTATVHIRDEIIIEKEVWNGEEWAEEVDKVVLDERIKFQITITYFGPRILEWMIVKDYLPSDYLEYAGNLGIKGAPIIELEIEEGVLILNWENEGFSLSNGKSVTIQFDTKLISYCYGEGVLNWAEVCASDYCNQDNPYHSEDSALVICIPPDPVFGKWVFDYNEFNWVKEAEVYVGDIVEFGIALTYWGGTPLENIQIVDELPKCLEYVDASIEESEIEDNIITWNFEDYLYDGESLTLYIRALVIDITSPCGCHGINTAYFSGYSSGCRSEYGGEDTAKIVATNKPPAKFEINFKRFNFRNLDVTISNIGEGDAYEVYVAATVTMKLRGITAPKGSTIPFIGSGSSVTTSVPWNILPVCGFVEIIVKAEVPGEDTTIKSIKGLKCGPFLILYERSI